MVETFPILDVDGHDGVPWACLAAFLPRIWANHRLTTYALAKRGVTVCEALAILEDRPMKVMDLAAATKRMDELITVWRAGRCRVAWGRLHGRYQGISNVEGLGSSNAARPRAPDRARKSGRPVRSAPRPRPSGW